MKPVPIDSDETRSLESINEPANINSQSEWLSSKEAKKELRITDCQLMHLHIEGNLPFKKVGNSYFYLLSKQSSG